MTSWVLIIWMAVAGRAVEIIEVPMHTEANCEVALLKWSQETKTIDSQFGGICASR